MACLLPVYFCLGPKGVHIGENNNMTLHTGQWQNLVWKNVHTFVDRSCLGPLLKPNFQTKTFFLILYCSVHPMGPVVKTESLQESLALNTFYNEAT